MGPMLHFVFIVSSNLDQLAILYAVIKLYFKKLSIFLITDLFVKCLLILMQFSTHLLYPLQNNWFAKRKSTMTPAAFLICLKTQMLLITSCTCNVLLFYNPQEISGYIDYAHRLKVRILNLYL